MSCFIHEKRDLFKERRITTVLIVSVLLCMLLFSSFYIVKERCHDCAGEDCPICMVIEQCENSLKTLTNGHILEVVVGFVLSFTMILSFYQESISCQNTLINQKVRLNN